MNKNEFSNIDIDELLNGFIDGELDARNKTRIQRLIKHDKQIAKRLQKLRNCRQLVSSLPYAEAPQGTLENIKAAVEKRPLPSRQPDSREGANHLFARRLVAAAAMFGLVAVLVAVIYSIVAPEVTIDKHFAAEQWQPAPEAAATVADKTEFRGKLLLQTEKPSEVVAFINGAVERNIPADERAAALAGLRESHTLTCSRQNFNSFMTDLANIWNKLDSATLFVDTDQPEKQIAVAAVVPEQIIEIASQVELETQIKAAQYFAALNRITPAEDTMLAEDSAPITIPKPVLTSGADRPGAGTEKLTETERKVILTIIVTDSE
jgi:hypothetical protein